MTRLRVFHLVYYGYEKTVVDSQVVTPAKRLASEGIDVEFVFLEDPIPWLRGTWREKKRALNAAGFRTHFLPRVPRNFLGLNTRRLTGLFSRFLAEGKPVVVHARGFQGADALLPLKRANPDLRLICDARGIEWAEYEMTVRENKGRGLTLAEDLWKRALEMIEKRAVRESDAVLCVSRSMIPYLSERAKRTDGAFDHVPCAVDADAFAPALQERDAVRRELGITEGPVVVYAGSMSAWQIPERSCRLAAAILSAAEGGRFLALTPTPEAFKALAVRAGLPAERVTALSVDHSAIPRYLAAADIGLLLRKDDVVNRYACPTKFAEYLACGLHVVATGAVDEVAATIRDTGCGTLLADLDDAAAVSTGAAAAVAASRDIARRQEISLRAARERFDWSRHLPTLKKWYLGLAQRASRPQ